MTPEQQEKWLKRFEVIYDAVSHLEGAVLELDLQDVDAPAYIEQLTDELHMELHRLIQMFNLSSTPGSQLVPMLMKEDLTPLT